MISQYSANYNELEDRILFRFNTTDLKEFRFWISRRVASKMLEVMPEKTKEGLVIVEELKLQSEQKPLVKKEAGKSDADVSRPVKKTPKFVKGNNFPTGEQPVLLYDVAFSLENSQYKCEFQLMSKQVVTVRIKPDIMLKVHSLITLMTEKAGWFTYLKSEDDLVAKGPLH